MARLDYESFREYCINNIVKVLGEEQYEAVFMQLNKNDETAIDSIQIKRKGMTSGSIPSFRVKEFYMDYCDGKSLGEVMLDIVKTVEELIDKPLSFDLGIFSAYDKAKDNLIIRPISFIKNQKLLSENVYWKHGDIALVLYMLIQNDENGLSSAKLPKQTASKWNLKEDHVLQSALENTAKLFPPIVLPLEFTMRGPEYLEQVPDNNKYFMDVMRPFKLLPSMLFSYYLSVGKGVNGATAAFYPAALARLSSILNDDLYLTFTSVRECLVHPASKLDINDVKKAAKPNPYVPPLEYLSSSVYKYSRSDDKLKMML